MTKYIDPLTIMLKTWSIWRGNSWCFYQWNNPWSAAQLACISIQVLYKHGRGRKGCLTISLFCLWGGGWGQNLSKTCIWNTSTLPKIKRSKVFTIIPIFTQFQNTVKYFYLIYVVNMLWLSFRGFWHLKIWAVIGEWLYSLGSHWSEQAPGVADRFCSRSVHFICTVL